MSSHSPYLFSEEVLSAEEWWKRWPPIFCEILYFHRREWTSQPSSTPCPFPTVQWSWWETGGISAICPPWGLLEEEVEEREDGPGWEVGGELKKHKCIYLCIQHGGCEFESSFLQEKCEHRQNSWRSDDLRAERKMWLRWQMAFTEQSIWKEYLL